MCRTCNLVCYRSHRALKQSTGEAGQDSAHSCQVYPNPKVLSEGSKSLRCRMPRKHRVSKLENYVWEIQNKEKDQILKSLFML